MEFDLFIWNDSTYGIIKIASINNIIVPIKFEDDAEN